MAEQESRDPVSRIMNAAWPEYGGNHQTIEFWNDFGEGVQFALKHLEATNGWLPIETAPEGRCIMWVADGKPMGEGGVAVNGTVYVYPDHRSYRPDGFHGKWNVTHWRPELSGPPIPHSTAA